MDFRDSGHELRYPAFAIYGIQVRMAVDQGGHDRGCPHDPGRFVSEDQLQCRYPVRVEMLKHDRFNGSRMRIVVPVPEAILSDDDAS